MREERYSAPLGCLVTFATYRRRASHAAHTARGCSHAGRLGGLGLVVAARGRPTATIRNGCCSSGYFPRACHSALHSFSSSIATVSDGEPINVDLPRW